MRNQSVVEISGIFSDVNAVLLAVKKLREGGFLDLTIYSPVAREEIFEALKTGTSPVRVWTLTGGILGCISGFALTIWTSLDWPIMTSAKPIVSIPAFVIIAFELTILFGALGTLLGFLINSRLPRITVETAYNSRFAEDRFGILVCCEAYRLEAVQDILQASGAEEVSLELEKA